MIRFHSVCKRYGATTALDQLDLEIAAGEFVFLTGPSGAGKTTFLQLISRAEFPTTGQLIVDGRNLARLTRRTLPVHRRQLGVVFQDFKLLADRSALDNVGFALKVLGLPPGEVTRRAYRALQAVGLAERRHQRPRQMSGGEQQRVVIARALINAPRLVLADEPTGNLDAEVAVEILKLLLEANRRGATIVVATHNPNLVASIKNKRVLELRGGRLVRNEVTA